MEIFAFEAVQTPIYLYPTLAAASEAVAVMEEG
jgi:hypothetical protein